MNDTGPEAEAVLKTRYAAMTGSERALMALQMFETAQQIVLSSLDPGLSENARRRELCRRFYGDELTQVAFPECADSQGNLGAAIGARFRPLDGVDLVLPAREPIRDPKR